MKISTQLTLGMLATFNLMTYAESVHAVDQTGNLALPQGITFDGGIGHKIVAETGVVLGLPGIVAGNLVGKGFLALRDGVTTCKFG